MIDPGHMPQALAPVQAEGSSRRTVLAGAAASLAWTAWMPLAHAQAGRRPPVWTGFGLNGSAMQSAGGAAGRGPAQDRFGLTRAWVARTQGGMELSNTRAFERVRELLLPQVRPLEGSALRLKEGANDKVEAGKDLLLGFAHDYETHIGARVEKDGDNANTLFVFMAGVGMVLGWDANSSWRMVSSFPFMLRAEWPLQSMNDVRGQAVGRMDEAYQQYTRAFVHFLRRFNKPSQDYSGNFFAQLTRAEVHREALPKLAALGIDQKLNGELLGFSASSTICDALGVPLLPFRENDALGKRYATKFSESIAAQDVAQIPDADLRFEVILRDIDKQVIPSRQKGITILRRQVVLNFRVLSAFDPSKPLLQTFAAVDPHDDKIPFESKTDDTPERDLVFFDRLVTRTLSLLLQGLAKRDAKMLAAVDVKLDAVAPAIPRLLEQIAKAR